MEKDATIRTACPKCRKKLLMRPDQAGRRIRCPKCNHRFGGIITPEESKLTGHQADSDEVRENVWSSASVHEEAAHAENANELVLSPQPQQRQKKAKVSASFTKPHDIVFEALLHALRACNCGIVRLERANLHARFTLDALAADGTEHDLYVFTNMAGYSELDITSKNPDEANRYDVCYAAILKEAGKFLMFANEHSQDAPATSLPPPTINFYPPAPLLSYRDVDEFEPESVGGRVCSILSCIFGAVAFLLCPPLFGIAGLTLGIIGLCLSKGKALGIIGVSLSVVGTLVGMILGALLMKFPF